MGDAMGFWFRVSAFLALVAVVCGCSSSEPEQASRSTGADSSTIALNSSAVNENSDPGDRANLEAPSSSVTTEGSSSTTAEPSTKPGPPEASIPPEPASNSDAADPPNKADLPEPSVDKGSDARDAVRREPAPDADVDRSPAKPKAPQPVVPSGKLGTSIGDTIPRIKGKDVEGARFELSDYEGKVVMIDFWGDW